MDTLKDYIELTKINVSKTEFKTIKYKNFSKFGKHRAQLSVYIDTEVIL